ncbi:MAG: phosphatase PAP2 family protein, partial [Desulfobulbaceae bacterium]|nr:phosphatase PAP2 family protein [Desulfobulbaceae bacterium]
QKGTTGRHASFPSGHASIAFYTLGPWFILREKRRKAAAVFLFFGIGFGAAVGLARMLQGGHFLSDVLWAGGIVYLVGGILALIFPPAAGSAQTEQKRAGQVSSSSTGNTAA